MHPVRLSTPRVHLRELEAEDVDALHRVYGDPEATRHLSFEPRSRDEVGRVLSQMCRAAAAQPRVEYALAVLEPSADRLVGLVRLELTVQRAGQIGLALHRDHWRRGLGRAAATAMIDFGFGPLGLHRIWGARSPLNAASAGLMNGLGMIEEGRIRDHVYVHGAWRDSIVHSVLEHEWAARRAADDRAVG